MSSYQSKIIRLLHENGYHVVKIIRLNKTGYPDILAMKINCPDVWIECKEKNDTLKPLQKKRIDELNEIGKNAVCLKDGSGVIYPGDQEQEIFFNNL